MEPSAFPNYQQLPVRMPRVMWWLLRGLTFALTCFVILLLFIAPEVGLVLTWQLLIPLLPLGFAVAPGIWRNICPMAFLNQLPRTLGFSREQTLSDMLRRVALYLSIAGFLAFVLLSDPLLHRQGWLLGLIFSLALLAAFAGGVIFKGRSGWCGTFCPLAPVQKAYGHAPLVLVRNGYCETCVGCQKNCYDFNPRAAIFSDLDDKDSWWSDQRKFFMGLLPGLIFAYFNTSFIAADGWWSHLVAIGGYALLSLGIFYLLHNALQVDYLRLSSLFVAVSLVLFYWYSLPTIADGLEKLSGVRLPESVVDWLRVAVLGVGMLMFLRAQLSMRFYREGQQQGATASLGAGVKKLRAALEQTGKMAQVHEHSSGRRLLVMPGQTLLDALQANELPIMSGCRMGLCGSDPVVITEGLENLAPPDDNELNTLKRLGLAGKARLACCCKPGAGIGIDLSLDPARVQESDASAMQQTVQTSALLKIVIIGNGIAGISCAERLREKDDKVQITLITSEPYHFYNRMGLEAVLHGKRGLEELYLVNEEWYQRNRIDIWLNTQVREILPDEHKVLLGTGKALDYDKLVLATGASAVVPAVPGFGAEGVFTLRNAEDALQIRSYLQRRGCRRALVLGGGVLGVETSDALQQMGLRVTLVHGGMMLMERQLDVRAAVMLENFLRNKGVKVMSATTIKRVDPVDELLRVILENGKQVITDLVLLCVGTRANTELARAAGLEVRQGVLVDATMRSSNPDIYCIGDAAELADAMAGLWSVGSEQGKVAAGSILGENEVYNADIPPPVQVKISGLDLKAFGCFVLDEAIQSYTDGDSDAQQWRHLQVRGGQVMAGVFVNSMQAANAAITASRRHGAALSPRDIHEIMKLDNRQKN